MSVKSFLLFVNLILALLIDNSYEGPLYSCTPQNTERQKITKYATHDSQTISNVGFPGVLPCTLQEWTILPVEPNAVLYYRWCVIHTEESQDCSIEYVKASTETKRRCGFHYQYEIFNTPGYMTVEFFSDKLRHLAGFQMSYCSGNCIPSCPDEIILNTPNVMTISSPNYPNNYPPNYTQCWYYRTTNPRLRFSYQMCNLHLEMTIMCAFDSIIINDDKPGELKCAMEQRETKSITGDTFMMCFNTDLGNQHSGFLLKLCLNEDRLACNSSCPPLPTTSTVLATKRVVLYPVEVDEDDEGSGEPRISALADEHPDSEHDPPSNTNIINNDTESGHKPHSHVHPLSPPLTMSNESSEHEHTHHHSSPNNGSTVNVIDLHHRNHHLQHHIQLQWLMCRMADHLLKERHPSSNTSVPTLWSSIVNICKGAQLLRNSTMDQRLLKHYISDPRHLSGSP